MTTSTETHKVAVERAEGSAGLASSAALETFVAQHYERLLGLARLVCRDAADAADAVQVGLELAWRKRESLRDPDRVKPWLDRIIVREAVRVSKNRQSRLRRLLTPSADVKWIDHGDARASEPATYAALRTAFARLSSEQRAVVALHLHLGYSVVETASIVGAPEETVRSRLRLAKDRLRHELGETVR